MDRTPDPYRELGVLRGASDAQIKAAHRRLAKRFHPDAPEGDTGRFLAVQAAYQLLSDPLRRRDWDAAHTPGPIRAGEPARSRARASAPGGSGAASATSAGGRRRAAGHRGPGDAERASWAWSATDREPATRSSTWSAAGVPWWEEFTPRRRSAAPDAGRTAPAPGGATGESTRADASGAAAGVPGTGVPGPGSAGPGSAGPGQAAGARSPEDMDVFARSSGAAWSMAARRHFRKGEADLAKGGSWTYRGTQVVTGAEARKVAAEQAVERARAAGREQAAGRAQAGGRARPAGRAQAVDALRRERPPEPRGATRTAPGGEPTSSAGTRPGPPATDPGVAATSLLGRVRRALGLS